MENSTDKFIQCSICKEKLIPGAIKCTHCGSFQNWRRHISFSSSFLSILLALISVTTVFITVTSESLTKNDSDIQASIINWQRTFFNDLGRFSQVLIVETFITNNGKRPAAIKAISLKGSGDKEFQYLGSGTHEVSDDYSHEEITAQIVEPGKTLILKNHIKTLLDAETFTKKYSNSEIRIEVVNFSGKKQNIEIDIKDTTPIFFK